jgi:hypothetical protein
MNINFRALFLASSGVLIAGPVMAQTRSSFLDTNSSSGITFNGTNGGLTVDVILGANPTFTVGANTYHVTSIIGFYALSDNNDLTVSNSDFGVWKTNNRNSGLGGIAGWKTNPNTGIGLNQHQSFMYQALNTNLVDRLGFHVVTSELFPGTSGNTGFIEIVPEPASFAVLGIGLFGILARRRKK